MARKSMRRSKASRRAGARRTRASRRSRSRYGGTDPWCAMGLPCYPGQG